MSRPPCKWLWRVTTTILILEKQSFDDKGPTTLQTIKTWVHNWILKVLLINYQIRWSNTAMATQDRNQLRPNKYIWSKGRSGGGQIPLMEYVMATGSTRLEASLLLRLIAFLFPMTEMHSTCAIWTKDKEFSDEATVLPLAYLAWQCSHVWSCLARWHDGTVATW